MNQAPQATTNAKTQQQEKNTKRKSKQLRSRQLVVSFFEPNSTAPKTHIWNQKTPLALGHPFKWILENTPRGIRVRNISSRPDDIRQQSCVEIDPKCVAEGRPVILPHSGKEGKTYLRFSPCVEMPAVYKNDVDVSVLGSGKTFAYMCLGNWVFDATTFKDHYHGKRGKADFFNLVNQNGKWQVKANTDLKILLDGKEQTLQSGSQATLSHEELLRVIVKGERLSWHFNVAQQIQVPRVNKDIKPDPDNAWFQQKLKQVGSVLTLGLLVVALWPKKEVEIKDEIIPAQYTKFVMSKPKPAAPPAAAPAAAAPAEAKNEPKAEKKVAKKKTKKKAKKVAAVKTKRVKNAAVVRAFRAKALQSSINGLLKGGMSTLLKQSNRVNRRKAGKVFSGKNAGAVATADLSSLTQERDVSVGKIGGKGKKGSKGVGYGKGRVASISGQGDSLVALDTGASSVAKGLSKDEVGKVIHAHLSEVRYCYESAMLRNPDIEGKLVVDFAIGGNGRVRTSSVKNSSLPDARLDDCILRRLARWKFPKPKGGVTVAVTYPFIFKTLGR